MEELSPLITCTTPLPILPQRRLLVLNVVSQKGGVGKTTMALLAARHLASRLDPPLVVVLDLDFPGTAMAHALGYADHLALHGS